MPRIVDHDHQRLLIARKAARVLARKGISKARLSDFASEANVTTGMILNYFANKDEIVAAALRIPFENLKQAMKERIEKGDTDLCALLEPCIPVTAARHVDNTVWVSFWGAVVSDKELARLNQELHYEANSLFQEAIETAWPESLNWPVLLMHEVRLTISTLLFGLSTGGVTNSGDWTPEAQSRILRTQLLLLRVWAENQS